jgi:hypothetical protein
MSHFYDLEKPGHLGVPNRIFRDREQSSLNRTQPGRTRSLQQTPKIRPMPVCSFELQIPALSFTSSIREFWYQKKYDTFVFHFCFEHFTFVHNSPSCYGGRGGGSLLRLVLGAQPPDVLPTPKRSAANSKTENNCCVVVIYDLCWQRPPSECHSRLRI